MFNKRHRSVVVALVALGLTAGVAGCTNAGAVSSAASAPASTTDTAPQVQPVDSLAAATAEAPKPDVTGLDGCRAEEERPGLLNLTLNGKSMAVPAEYWSLDKMAILLPDDGWDEEDDYPATLTASPDAANDVAVTFRHYAGDQAAAAAAIDQEFGCTVEYAAGPLLGDVPSSTGRGSAGEYVLTTTLVESDGTYAVICRCPQALEENWRDNLEQIAGSLCFYAGRGFRPDGLTAATDTGVGVFLDYADSNLLVFHGYFGVFVYDLRENEIELALDLMKTVGSANIQGSDGVGVSVSRDGKTLMLCHYTESGADDRALYVNTADGTCRLGGYTEMQDPFIPGADGSATVQGQSGTIQDTDHTLGGLQYRWGGSSYPLFEEYFEP